MSLAEGETVLSRRNDRPDEPAGYHIVAKLEKNRIHFQPHNEYGLYILAFFILLELLPLITLVYVVGVQTEARMQVRSNLISTQEDVFLASYSSDPLRSVEPL